MPNVRESGHVLAPLILAEANPSAIEHIGELSGVAGGKRVRGESGQPVEFWNALLWQALPPPSEGHIVSQLQRVLARVGEQVPPISD